MAYEHKKQPLASPAVFRRRLFHHSLAGASLIVFSLVLGTAGYCAVGKQIGLLDGFYNASMILTGMGPATSPEQTTPGVKLFAALYALYSGIAFLAAVSIVMAPVLHRLLHIVHLDEA
jgi:hypothetical protein